MKVNHGLSAIAPNYLASVLDSFLVVGKRDKILEGDRR
jgi:hypothetical protein